MADEPIHVLHLTPQLSRLGGGAAAYLWDLVKFTSQCGVQSHVAGLGDEHTEADIAGHAAVSVFAGKPNGNPAHGFSSELNRYLKDSVPRVDLIHAHGLRTGIGLAALRHVRRTNLPLLITPHGSFFPQLMERSPMRKWVVERLWDRRYRQAAKCFHATSPTEAELIRKYHPDKPIGVVPIGLDIDKFSVPPGDWITRRHPQLAGKRRLLFLGIMDRKKGLLLLAQAWGQLAKQFPDWRLLIAGPNFKGHEIEVKQAIEAAGATNKTVFLGGVWGDDKSHLLAESDVFVLPTEWENFGIVVAEALASRLPVITTRGAPWSEIESAGCGWWIERNVDAIADALRAAMSLSDEQRGAMGDKGRALVSERYAWPGIARQMRALYEWVIDRRDQPAFV
jgi:glycosyltransferase involved in cell wall biosynthesis